MSYDRESAMRYHWKNRERRNAAKRKWDAEHADVVRARHAELKAKVLAAYGGKCAQCGAAEALDVDHVHGDGRAHRAAIGVHSGNAFYRWLVKNGLPQDGRFQLLCRRCHNHKTHGERYARKAA